MTSELTPETKRTIAKFFAEGQHDEVARLLEDECGANLPLLQGFSPVQLDRFRFAVIKVSGGDIAKLREAVRLAKYDWRDLLVSAGFANDPDAHRKWYSANVGS